MIGVEGDMMTSVKPRASHQCDYIFISAFTIVSIILLAHIHFTPRAPNSNVAVIFPPWVRSGRAIESAVAAGASILRLGRFPFIAVVHPNGPHYADRVFAKGAWLVLDPEVFGGCLARGGLQP